MTNILTSYRWVVDHPFELVGVLMILLAIAYVIGAIVFSAWLSHEKRKAESRRETLERILRASTPPTKPTPIGRSLSERRSGR